MFLPENILKNSQSRVTDLAQGRLPRSSAGCVWPRGCQSVRKVGSFSVTWRRPSWTKRPNVAASGTARAGQRFYPSEGVPRRNEVSCPSRGSPCLASSRRTVLPSSKLPTGRMTRTMHRPSHYTQALPPPLHSLRPRPVTSAWSLPAWSLPAWSLSAWSLSACETGGTGTQGAGERDRGPPFPDVADWPSLSARPPGPEAELAKGRRGAARTAPTAAPSPLWECCGWLPRSRKPLAIPAEGERRRARAPQFHPRGSTGQKCTHVHRRTSQ